METAYIQGYKNVNAKIFVKRTFKYLFTNELPDKVTHRMN